MATLKLTPKYFNSYEAAYAMLSKNDWFKQSTWESAAKKGELDQYISILENTDKIKDKEKFYSDYMYEFSDDRTSIDSLYTELFADRTNSDTVRKRYVKNPDGTYKTDAKGNPITEEYKASDYDYYKEIIRTSNQANYERYLQQQEQERKDSMNGFVKFLGTAAGIGTEFLYGLTNQLDNLFASIGAIGSASNAIIKNEDAAEAIVNTYSSNQLRLFEDLGVQDWIIDFERRYTEIRDLDGNYSATGKYLGGVASTLGQMLPSMLAGKVVKKIPGATAKTAQRVSTLVFYQGVTAGSVRDMYQSMAKNDASVPSSAILTNATIKSTLQWGVEVGLAKFLGGTSLDNMVFGRSVSAGSKSLRGAALKRVAKDFIQEGMEEVFQDTSDFLVDKAFTTLINENFGDISITWQSLSDAFIIGGLTSFAGSVFGRNGILATKRVVTPNVKVDKEGNPVYKKGEIVFEKLSKLESWEYGLDMQSFMENFAILQEQGQGLAKQYDTTKSKEGLQYAAAFTGMYAAYRMVSSIYNDIGDERFNAANDVLKRITSMIRSGKFNSSNLKQASKKVMESLQSLSEDSIEIALDKIEQAGITRISKSIERGEDLSKINISESTKSEIEKLFKGDDSIKHVVLTEDGNNVVLESGYLFVPLKYANKAGAETIYETVAEQVLVKKIVSGHYKGLPLDTVLSTFKEVTGNDKATMEEAVYNLVFNESFFNIILYGANIDMFNFVSSLIKIEQNVVKRNLRDAIYSQKISKIVESMKKSIYEYLVNQPFADYRLDFFTYKEQKKIAGARWCRNLYSRVTRNDTFKKLSENDWNVLRNRVNSLPVSSVEKDRLLLNLKSENSDVRTSAMNRISTAYQGIFTSKYDGKTYMPYTTVPNRTFNAFLQNNGLTIETIVDMDVDVQLKNTIVELYGEFNQENLIKFRQAQFMRSCNNKYTFRYTKTGKIGIYEASTNKQVGFSTYNEKAEELLSPEGFKKKTAITRSSKNQYLVKDILNSSLDEATASYLSIDDVINDPSLLSEQIQADIQLKYGDVNIETSFMYLREYFLNKLKNVTVIALSDGTYAFGDVTPMMAMLKDKDLKITKNTTVQQLIKPYYLYGRLPYVKVQLVDREIIAEYNSENNTIYINRKVAENGGSMLSFAFLHEFQHAIQVENGMNIGISGSWISLKTISKETKRAIINDVRKHRPELFKDVAKGSTEEAKIVNNFVYFSSGESTALGLDASKLIDFYPTIVATDTKGTRVQFPWGTSHYITKSLPMSLVAKFGKFDIELTDKERKFYKTLSKTAYNEMTTEYSDKALGYFMSQESEDVVPEFIKFLAVNDDKKFIVDFYNSWLDEAEMSEVEDEYFYAINECYNLVNERLVELSLLEKGIEDIDKVELKEYSVDELKDLFFKYNTNIGIESFADSVFKTFKSISDNIWEGSIKVTNYFSKLFENGKVPLGYQIGDMVRYDYQGLLELKRTKAAELYLHEAIHFITSPLIYTYKNSEFYSSLLKTNNLDFALNQLESILSEAKKSEVLSVLFTQRVKNLEEFCSAISDRNFMAQLEKLESSSLLDEQLKILLKSKLNIEVNNKYDLYIALMNYIVSNISFPSVYVNYYDFKSLQYEYLSYPESHDGKIEKIKYDSKLDKFYRVDESSGEYIYEEDVNYDYVSSLGPSDYETSMSLKKKDTKVSSEDKLKALDVSLEGKVEETAVKKPGEKVPTKKRYVSQKKSAGTNLEKYGYTSKYKRTQMSPELQKFIVNATEIIDEELWEKVTSGKITTQDVMDFLRNSSTIDDVTFKLINDSFFHNDKIKTFKELKEFIDVKTPKYYAMRAMVKSLGYGNVMISNTDPRLLDRFLEIVEKDTKLKKIYDDIVERYYTYKGNPLDISEKYLRRIWMQYFDGSAQTAGYIAAIAKAGAINKWVITGEASSKTTKSLQDTVGDDLSVEEVIEDTSALEAFSSIFNSGSRDEKINDILKVVGMKFVKKTVTKYLNQGYTKQLAEKEAAKKLLAKGEQLRKMSDAEFARQYAIIVKKMSDEEINDLFAKQLIAESAGLDISKLSDKQMYKLEEVTKKVIPSSQRPSSAIVNNIRSIVRTIKLNLSEKDRARFLKENSDIFDESLNIKYELLHKTDKNGNQLSTYEDIDKLLVIEDRVRQLSKDVRAKVYQSSRSLNFKKQMDKKLKALEKENERLVEELAKGKTSVTAVTYEISDEQITIDSKREIPEALKRILANEFTKVLKSKTQYLLEGETYHIQGNLNKFIADNADLLNSLTQSDVDDIVDFYLNSEILPSTNKARQYSAIQVYLMTYLIKGNKIGKFILTEEQARLLNNRLENIISLSAANLANWKSAMRFLNPEQIIIQSYAKSMDIEFSVEDVKQLTSAIETGDISKILAAKRNMYEKGLREYKGRKTSFLDKLFRFERVAMLSGPGTWIRNQISNVMVSAGNIASEKIGYSVSSTIEKMFPKKKWKRDKQYKIVGTKVPSNVQTFIKEYFIDNGFMELIRDGINKYDVKKATKNDMTQEESLTKIVVQSIKSEIFQKNTFKNETLNKMQQIVFKFLSDDKSINKAAVRYLGKILVEDNVDLSQGLSMDVLNRFAKAYKLASYDYMHKSNFFNKIEGQLRNEWGDGAYFAYKQVFPFASASWNWFLEGINYTPVGLAMAIKNFAKLENTIEKLEEKRSRGEDVISTDFAEYVTRRNIGKGVIGSIGTLIGLSLALLGFAGIDEEDDKYKLFVRIGNEKVTVDISDVFGTQGIMLGITLVSGFIDQNFLAAAGDTLDTMFSDMMFSDLFNTFRYSDSFGDWLVNQPFQFLNMFVPNFVKTLSSVANVYGVQYSSGVEGKIQRLIVNSIPGLAYAFPKQIDIYSGENQIAYKMQFVTNIANKLLPFKIYPYNVSSIEKEAVSLGVSKNPLTGRYQINGESVNLTSSDLEELNRFYGELNKNSLSKLFSNKTSYKVFDSEKGVYVELKYNAMSDGQKKTVIERIMSDNGQAAKIYILTSKGLYKYYASSNEYSELRKLGINVLKKTGSRQGFIKN